MEKVNYNEMGNSELKMYIEQLSNEFEAKKIKLKELCENMDKIEREYLKAKHELEIRRNLYI
jgi:flagellar biosynthesis chaperone FliJ